MRLLIALLLLFLFRVANGQKDPCVFTDSAILHRLKTDIFLLASDSFQGREAGTYGDSLAVSYLISRFREAGLEPKGDDSGSYLQTVPFEYFLHPFDGNYLYAGDTRYIHRQDFGMTSFSATGTAGGNLLDVGHGLVDPELRLNNYAGKPDPDGRVLLMEFPLPEDLLKDSLACKWFSVRNRLSEAFHRGAAAVLLWNSDSPDYPEMFDFSRPDTMPGPVVFIAERIARQLKRKEGQLISLMVTVSKVHTTYANVIGYLDHQASQTVILGAHYDHVGLNNTGVPRCGADDNASGVALLLEMARYLKQNGNPRLNYLFIAFGAEELGMVGSRWFCTHPLVPLDQVRFMCNFDMVGRLGAEGNRLTILGTATSPQWRQIYREMPDFDFRIKSYKGPSGFSDQECFYKKKIPIFYLTTGMHADYHTHRDRPERINYTGMVKIVRYAEVFASLAGETEPITFTPVSGWATLFSDLNYFIRQIGHFFEMPMQDWK